MSLYYYQSKASGYRKELIHLKNKVTTNQTYNRFIKTKKRTQTQYKRKSSNHKRENKNGQIRKYKINRQTRFKMAINNLSIITLNVNALKVPVKKHMCSCG